MCRMKDVGKSKAEIAAERIMARIEGVKVTPHFCRIEEKPLDFFQDFQIWVLGLDSLDARRYMNQIACSFLREPRPSACMTVAGLALLLKRWELLAGEPTPSSHLVLRYNLLYV